MLIKHLVSLPFYGLVKHLSLPLFAGMLNIRVFTVMYDVLARLKAARKNEEAADEMPMSGDDTVRPQTAILSGGVGRTLGCFGYV